MQVEQLFAKALQQLEAAGYIVKKNKGRLVSDEGMKRIDRVATELYKEIIKTVARDATIRLVYV